MVVVRLLDQLHHLVRSAWGGPGVQRVGWPHDTEQHLSLVYTPDNINSPLNCNCGNCRTNAQIFTVILIGGTTSCVSVRRGPHRDGIWSHSPQSQHYQTCWWVIVDTSTSAMDRMASFGAICARPAGVPNPKTLFTVQWKIFFWYSLLSQLYFRFIIPCGN